MRLVHLVPVFTLALIATPALAIDVDLTTPFASGSIGAATFTNNNVQTSGTGVIEPFVRIQHNPSESGWNVDSGTGSGDLSDVKGGTWTHSIRVGDIATVSGSVQLFLDINQSGSSALISMDELRIFTSTNPNIQSLSELNSSNLVYDMGAGNRVLMNAVLNSGSGSGDVYATLPAASLDGLDDQYFYLYSKFGASGSPYTSNGGFEEWTVILKKKP